MMNTIALLLHISTVAILVGKNYAYIYKVPGTIKGSYKYSNDSWACPVVKEVNSDGSIDRVTLTVIPCYGSSQRRLECGSGWGNVEYIPLERNGQPKITIKGNKYFFNTAGLAQFFGRKVCLSWLETFMDATGKVISASCKHKCIEKSFGPALQSRSSSRLGNYVEYKTKYEVTSSSRTLYGVLPGIVFGVLIVCFTSFL